jgi:hypothetical protein
MKKLSVSSLIYILPILLLIADSCSDGSCIDETESLLKANLYLYGSSTLKAPDSLTVYALNKVSEKVYSKATNVTTALIPLNSAANESVFIIRINGINDTVKFRYTSYPHLISKECGYTYYHDLENNSQEFTKHIIDSIEIKNSTITTLKVENIRIFY